MEIQVVHHCPDAQAIDDVAQRAADESDVSHRFEPTAHAAPQGDRQECTNRRSQSGEEVALPSAGIGQKRKGCPRVQDMNQIEKRGDFDAAA